MTSNNVTTNEIPCDSCQNSTTVTTELKNPLSVHGGFIAMAAGLSVVVPLVCVLFIQLRRARREERERRLRQNGNDQESGSGLANDPPPTYEQLFGPGYEPNLAPQPHGHGSSDMLIVEDDTGDGGLVNPVHQSQSTDSDSGNDSGDGGDPSSTPSADFPVSVISGNEVRDAVVTGSVSNSLDSDSSIFPVQVVSLDVNRLRQESLPPQFPSSAPTYSSNSSSVTPASQPTSSTRQSSSLAPPTQSSASSSNPTNVPNGVSSPEVPLSAPSSHPLPLSPAPLPPTQRVFPGMHISLHEFFSAIRNQSDREPPPPSYEEALKILEKAEEAKKKSKK